MPSVILVTGLPALKVINPPIDDVYVDIGDDNYFAPGPVDRGQPTVFLYWVIMLMSSKSEFSAEEVKKAKAFDWTVRKIGIRVDFAKTEDASLDCNNLPY